MFVITKKPIRLICLLVTLFAYTQIGWANSTLPTVTLSATPDSEPATISFGQVFLSNALSKQDNLTLTFQDKAEFNVQIDPKLYYPNGSIKFAVLSAVVTLPATRHDRVLQLVKTKRDTPQQPQIKPPNSAINFTFEDGKQYTLKLTQPNAAKPTTWLNGPFVTEWQITGRPVNTNGEAHDDLFVIADIQFTPSLNQYRIRYTTEHNWIFDTKKSDLRYSVNIQIDDKTKYSNSAITHFPNALWTTTVTSENYRTRTVLHEVKYLQNTQFVPTYEQVSLPADLISRIDNNWDEQRFVPMARGLVLTDMGTTGERNEIGPLPGWQAWYLISGKKRFLDLTLRQGELAGSWPIHYRVKTNNALPTIDDYPYITRLGNKSDANNRKQQRNEYITGCQGECTSPFKPDSSHQPSFAYLPYLLSGEHFYLRELQYWANFNLVRYHPQYRELSKGILRKDQVRGQAWSLRTLAHAAFSTPKHADLADYFTEKLQNNINWYNQTYVTNKANNLGWIYPLTEDNKISPWMDDFMTWAAAHVVDLGFDDLTPFRNWKANFAVQRMTNPHYCWVFSAPYRLPVAHQQTKQPLKNMTEVYAAFSAEHQAKLGTMLNNIECGSQQMFSLLDRSAGDIPGNYTMILQIALASAKRAGIPNADNAWKLFNQRTPRLIPSRMPEYAVFP